MATYSWNDEAEGNPTAGLGEAQVFDKPVILCIPHSLFECEALIPHHFSMVHLHNLIVLTGFLVLVWELHE